MNKSTLKKTFIAAFIFAIFGYSAHALAHTAIGTLDPNGNNPNDTALAQVTCYNDDDGDADHLYIQIQDNSSPIPGLYVSAQILKDNSANGISTSSMSNTTDTTSGDAAPSNPTAVGSGNGLYWLSVSKTNVAGPRNFTITYHCQTANDVHTGTCGPGDGCGILQGRWSN